MEFDAFAGKFAGVSGTAGAILESLSSLVAVFGLERSEAVIFCGGDVSKAGRAQFDAAAVPDDAAAEVVDDGINIDVCRIKLSFEWEADPGLCEDIEPVNTVGFAHGVPDFFKEGSVEVWLHCGIL